MKKLLVSLLVLLTFVTGQTHATIAAVASQAGKASGDATTGVSRAFGSNVSVGSMVLVICSRYTTHGSDPYIAGDTTKSAGTATIGTVSLDKNYEIDDGDAAHIQVGIWSALVTGAGSLTMQCAGGASDDYITMASDEYTGSFDGSRVEDTDQGGSGSNGQTSAATGTLTSAGAGMFVGGIVIDGGANPTTMTRDGAFALIAEETNGAVHIPGSFIRQIVGSGTTDAVEWGTISGQNGWAAAGVVYKETGGGGGGTTNAGRRSLLGVGR